MAFNSCVHIITIIIFIQKFNYFYFSILLNEDNKNMLVKILGTTSYIFVCLPLTLLSSSHGH